MVNIKKILCLFGMHQDRPWLYHKLEKDNKIYCNNSPIYTYIPR